MTELLNPVASTDASHLQDLLLVLAKNIEKSLIAGGAVGGQDYTILDLYKLAQPFALTAFETGKVGFTPSDF